MRENNRNLFKLILTIFVVIFILFVSILNYKLHKQAQVITPNNASNLKAVPTTPNQTDEKQKTDVIISEYQYKLYTSNELNISLSYPDTNGSYLDYIPNTKSLVFTYFGKYQGKSITHDDGIEMLFSTNKLDKKNLLEQIQTIKSGPSEAIQTVSYKNISGYQNGNFAEFTEGESTNIYFQNSPSSFVTVDVMIMDNHNLGYSQIVDKIMNSLKVTR
jgi:hypothetical protein